MEMFYKLLCFVGLARVEHFETELGGCVVTNLETQKTNLSPSDYIHKKLLSNGAPVTLYFDGVNTKLMRGYIIKRITDPKSDSLVFRWYRKDHRYEVHPLIKLLGVK